MDETKNTKLNSFVMITKLLITKLSLVSCVHVTFSVLANTDLVFIYFVVIKKKVCEFFPQNACRGGGTLTQSVSV